MTFAGITFNIHPLIEPVLLDEIILRMSKEMYSDHNHAPNRHRIYSLHIINRLATIIAWDVNRPPMPYYKVCDAVREYLFDSNMMDALITAMIERLQSGFNSKAMLTIDDKFFFDSTLYIPIDDIPHIISELTHARNIRMNEKHDKELQQ